MQTSPSGYNYNTVLPARAEAVNRVSGVLLAYLLLMNLVVIAVMLVEVCVEPIRLTGLGYNLNAALNQVMQRIFSPSCCKMAPVTWWSPACAFCSFSCGRSPLFTGRFFSPRQSHVRAGLLAALVRVSIYPGPLFPILQPAGVHPQLVGTQRKTRRALRFPKLSVLPA